MAIPPIAPVGGAFPGLAQIATATAPAGVSAAGQSFGSLLANGLDALDTKVAKADALMKAYALGETIPVHQVTIALEEARIAVEMAVQVRERLTESYRSFMNMQL